MLLELPCDSQVLFLHAKSRLLGIHRLTTPHPSHHFVPPYLLPLMSFPAHVRVLTPLRPCSCHCLQLRCLFPFLHLATSYSSSKTQCCSRHCSSGLAPVPSWCTAILRFLCGSTSQFPRQLHNAVICFCVSFPENCELLPCRSTAVHLYTTVVDRELAVC